jgi:hypothetical protein
VTAGRPALEALGKSVGEALALLHLRFTILVEALDLADGAHDDAAELILRARELSALARDLAAAADQRVLAWFRSNKHGHRDVVVGEFRFYGERVKREKVRDLPKAFGALARAELAEPVGRATAGDVDAAAMLFGALEQFAASFVSASGLKAGACRSALARHAEAELRAGLVEPSEQEVEAAGRAAFEALWEVEWPDKLGSQEGVKETLGVANLRFLLAQTSDQRTKKQLQEMLDRADVRRKAALAREGGRERAEGSDRPAAGSWERALWEVEEED